MSPPKENHPSMWVFKLGVDSPREVITYDLEEFAKVGISDFMIIGNGAAITAAKPYGEPALKGKMHGARADRLRWALHEANRLGLGVWIMLTAFFAGISGALAFPIGVALLLMRLRPEPGETDETRRQFYNAHRDDINDIKYHEYLKAAGAAGEGDRV